MAGGCRRSNRSPSARRLPGHVRLSPSRAYSPIVATGVYVRSRTPFGGEANMSNGNNNTGGGSTGAGGSTGGGDTTDSSVIKPEQMIVVAAAAAVGGLIGGLVGSLIGSAKG